MSARRVGARVGGGRAGEVVRGARDVALAAAGEALAGRAFAVETLARQRGSLDAREAGLAHEIALGTLRHGITIDHVLAAVGKYDPRRVPAVVRAGLHAGVYQMVWMDAVPDFAAVDETVGAVRRVAGARAAGMVNALLRAVGRGIAERRAGWQRLNAAQVRVGWDRACAFQREVLPASEQLELHLAAATGERAGRFREMSERFGVETAEEVAWASQATPAIALQRNSLRIDAAGFAEAVRAAFGEAALVSDDVALLPAGAAIVSSELFQKGLAFVQDLTAHEAAARVGARAGERVLDLCAAPGGKSIAVAMQMGNEGQILAADVSAERLAKVRENAERLGIRCIETRVAPATPDAEWLAGAGFDAAIVDVPCSNTGVIARRPEARLGLTRAKLASLVDLQRRLLETALAAVRPGGRVIYSTCSIEREENEGLLAEFVNRAGLQIGEQELTLPRWGSQASDWRDGGFAAMLRAR